jgi:hypothetical protein
VEPEATIGRFRCEVTVNGVVVASATLDELSVRLSTLAGIAVLPLALRGIADRLEAAGDL